MVYSSKKYYPPSAHFLPSGLLLSDLFLSRLLPSKPTTCGQSVPLAIVHRSRNLGPTCGTHHCGEIVENAVEEMNNRILRETKCHSWKSVFKEFDLVRFNIILPSGSLCSNLKRLHSYYWKENFKDHYPRRSHHIFQALTYNFHTGFHGL